MAQVAYKYTWTLPRLHGLDNYSLGMNLNWHGHKSGLDKISCSINFAHFLGVKNHFLFSYISHMSWFYILELFFVPKNTLFVSCFRAVCRPLVPKSLIMSSAAPSLQRRFYVLLVIKYTVRRRYLTNKLKWWYLMFLEKLCFVDNLWLSMLFVLIYTLEDNLH